MELTGYDACKSVCWRPFREIVFTVLSIWRGGDAAGVVVAVVVAKVDSLKISKFDRDLNCAH